MSKLVVFFAFLETVLIVNINAFSKKSPFRKHQAYFSQRVAELKADGKVDKLIEKYLKYWQDTAAL